MKLRRIFIIILLAAFCVSGLPAEIWRVLEIPQTLDIMINPNNTETISIQPSERLSFYDGEYVSLRVEGQNKIRISGKTDKKYVLLQVRADGKEIEKEIVRVKKDGFLTCTVTIPDTAQEHAELVIYTNDQYYGDYKSWVTQYLYFTKRNGQWEKAQSPVYTNNAELFSGPKSLTRATRASRNVQSEDPAIISLAKEITKDCTSEYDKVRAIHDYICGNLYYDTALQGTGKNYSAADALSAGTAICAGYANAFAALCRSIGIPCLLVSGYSTDENMSSVPIWNEDNTNTQEPNHAWNEVYVDGRWMVIDTTWDCGNKFINGEKIQERDTNYLYFDANIEFFSANHKILSYKDI